MFYTYILLCADNKTYTGHTSDLKERIERHINGHVPATKGRRPVKLIYYAAFIDQYKSIEFEKYLKSGQVGHL